MNCRLVKIYRYKIHLLPLSYKNHAPTQISWGNFYTFKLLYYTISGSL